MRGWRLCRAGRGARRDSAWGDWADKRAGTWGRGLRSSHRLIASDEGQTREATPAAGCGNEQWPMLRRKLGGHVDGATALAAVGHGGPASAHTGPPCLTAT